MTPYDDEETKFVRSLIRLTVERKITWTQVGHDLVSELKGKQVALRQTSDVGGFRMDVTDLQTGALTGIIKGTIALRDLALTAQRSAGGMLDFMKAVIDETKDS
jgi:hypothetical protein